ncbi:MAG: alkaline phosphatase [Kiritimatiellae bacterium]|nr:alkaline phosphatase [Kiritimatiellia bacterium]
MKTKSALFLSLIPNLVVATLTTICASKSNADIILYDAANASISSKTSSTFTVTGEWDLSKYGEIQFELDATQITQKWIYIKATLENENAQPQKSDDLYEPIGQYSFTLFTEKRERILRAPIPPSMETFQATIAQFPAPRAKGLFHIIWPHPFWTYKDAGWGNSIISWMLDSKRVVKLTVKNNGDNAPLPILKIIARGEPNKIVSLPEFAKIPPEKFFPCIDQYGQFKWRDWPGKIKSDADLALAKAKEDADLAAHPGPSGRNKWGGWSDGPRFEATGSFYLRKVRGKWWFIDPEGCLWWSHGPVRVSSSCGMTPIKNREKLFDFLPEEGTKLSEFYHTRDELLWPYYVKRALTNTYDFTSANLWRKYGDDWRNEWTKRVHKRLKSWGANTIANSSDRRVMKLSATPYCDRIEIKSRSIAGTEKALAWWPFRDPFDPSFNANIKNQLSERKAQLDDPWCFGFFVDNELCWGSEGDLGKWVWESPEDQPARQEFCQVLKKKYGKIPEKPSTEDFNDFSLVVAEAYFKNVRSEFKKIAPNKLYLGCRFSGSMAETIKRIAAKYCDVLSFNYYERDVSAFPALPSGVDKPIIIGEFHFGALDRGPINSGLILLKNQYERASTYQRYLESALRNPQIVGAHWHQYADDVSTGRFDGENFQIGWVDICDTPYPETINAVRWVGENMYTLRYGQENVLEAAKPVKRNVATNFKAPKHVIFIGLDGLSGRRYAQGLNMPRLQALADAGVWTHSSRCQLPSASGCNWRTIFSCSPIICHGYTAWNSKAPDFTPTALNEFGKYPDIFSELRRQRPDAKIEYIYEWPGMAFVVDTNACNFVINSTTKFEAEKTTAIALSRIEKDLPNFLAIVYDNPDHVGHSNGWESKEYAECCTLLDTCLGQIVDAVKAKGALDDTVFVITADHGGIGRRHGKSTIHELESPVVFYGSNIPKNRRIKGQTLSYDVGATLAKLLGLELPQAWPGRPIEDIFAP